MWFISSIRNGDVITPWSRRRTSNVYQGSMHPRDSRAIATPALELLTLSGRSLALTIRPGSGNHFRFLTPGTPARSSFYFPFGPNCGPQSEPLQVHPLVELPSSRPRASGHDTVIGHGLSEAVERGSPAVFLHSSRHPRNLEEVTWFLAKLRQVAVKTSLFLVGNSSY